MKVTIEKSVPDPTNLDPWDQWDEEKQKKWTTEHEQWKKIINVIEEMGFIIKDFRFNDSMCVITEHEYEWDEEKRKEEQWIQEEMSQTLDSILTRPGELEKE